MKYYINPNTGELFAYESDGSQDAIIPEAYRPASEAEVDAIHNPPLTPEQQKINIQAEIDSLERIQLLPRITREFMLLQFATVAAQQGIDPMTNIAYAKLKAFDDQITALRSQL